MKRSPQPTYADRLKSLPDEEIAARLQIVAKVMVGFDMEQMAVDVITEAASRLDHG